MDRYEEGSTFSNFVYWCTYGIPDRNVTSSELREKMQSIVHLRQTQDPSYGFTPSGYTDIPDRQKRLVGRVFGYISDTNPVHDLPIISRHSLTDTLGYKEKQVQYLVEQGVIESPEGKTENVDVFTLTPVYYAHWLVNACKRETLKARAQS